MSSALLGLAPTSGVVAGAGSSAAASGGLAALVAANPLLLPFLLSFGPAAISKLFGQKSQSDKLREEVERLLAERAKRTNEYFRQVVSSPAYSAAQGSIATGANQASNNVAANLAERGIGTTGTGAVLSGLTPSLVGSQQSTLLANAHKQAMDMFQKDLETRLDAIKGFGGPSPAGMALGRGVEQFSPYLLNYLKKKFPGSFNVTAPAPITGQTVTG